MPAKRARRWRRVAVRKIGYKKAIVTLAPGKGFPDLVRLRTGVIEAFPDAVVFPSTAVSRSAIPPYSRRYSAPVIRSGSIRPKYRPNVSAVTFPRYPRVGSFFTPVSAKNRPIIP